MTTQKQTNPFWYRENSQHLFGVTNLPTNPQIGVLGISLKPTSQKQLAYGMIFNGLLTTPVGTLSFQVRVSKAGAPYISTASDEVGVKEDGVTKRYWNHIVLNANVKAQILRHTDAVRSGQLNIAPVEQPQQNQMYQGQQNQMYQPQQNQMYQGQQNQMYPQYQQPQQHQGVDSSAHVPSYVAPDALVGAGAPAPVVGAGDDLPF